MESGSVPSKTDKNLLLALGVVRLFLPSPVAAQSSKSATATDWDRLVEAAKNEAKLTISIPASAELRKQLKENCKKRFGIEVEVFTARGSAGVRRMADESKSGYATSICTSVALLPLFRECMTKESSIGSSRGGSRHK